MNSNSHRGIPNSLPPLQILSSGDMISPTISKLLPSLNTKDFPTSLTFQQQKNSAKKSELGYVPSPADKVNSFSDIISPHNVQTVVNMSLEKELDRDVRKSLHTMSDHSDLFEESSIHKDGTQKPGLQSGFDLKEHDSLLNENVPADIAEQLNKKICILCHNSQQVHTTIQETEISKSLPNIGEYDLIYPCLCRIRAHRECMKSYILLKKIASCERCKTKYAVSGKRMKEINLPKNTFLLMAVAALACLVISVIGIALMVSSFSGSGVALAAAGIIVLIVGILGLGFLVWKKYFSKKIVDLAIYCKQTEIARHSDFSEFKLRKFIDDEESKRNSRILSRSRKILNLTDVTEFETFVKMTTPRLDKNDKVPNHERSGSSNFLLADQSKHRDIEDEDSKKKTRKEIFIAPTEIEKSENTVPDYPNNVNEYSAKLKGAAGAISQIRITISNPSKHMELSRNPPRPENRREPGIVGSQSERTYIDITKRIQPSRIMRMPTKEPQSANSIGTMYGFSARDPVSHQDLLSAGLPKRAV